MKEENPLQVNTNNQMSTFLEQKWGGKIPFQYRIPFKVINLNAEHIQYLVSDQTNPDLNLFQFKSIIQHTIVELGGTIFTKFANRSPKDCSSLAKQVKSVYELVMLVKMSEYLTQGLCQDKQSSIVLKKYLPYLENGENQFRVYIINRKIVGICQKQPCFLSQDPTLNQLKAIKAKCIEILQSVFQKTEVLECVMDIYCSLNGLEFLLMNMQPFHINSLSLFNENQLRQHYSKNKAKPLVRMVKQQKDLKDIDLSEYRPGAQLKNLSNVKEWIQLMESSNKEGL